MKRAFGALALAAAALPLAGLAQPWPSHPVRIVATSPPGGSVDFLARALAEDFGETFGKPFVVENRPGANGNIGVDLVMKAPADGHAMFVSPPGPFAINAHLMSSHALNPATDVAPAMLGVAPLLLVASRCRRKDSANCSPGCAARAPTRTMPRRRSPRPGTSRWNCSSRSRASMPCTFPTRGRPRRRRPTSSPAAWR
jgi:hypothetical protein